VSGLGPSNHIGVDKELSRMNLRSRDLFCRFAVILTLAAGTLVAGKYNAVVQIGTKAPAFNNLPAIDGKSYSMSEFKEDVVVLVFLANHCPWVRGGERDLIQLVNDFKGRSVRFIGIGVNLRPEDTLPAMKDRASKAGYNFLYLHDPSQEIGRKLGATHTPEYFVLNKERQIVYTGLLTNSPAVMEGSTPRYVSGQPKDFYVRDAIDAALAGRPVTVTETRAQGCTVEYTRKAN
jgi:peroxiredoxin